MIKRRGLRSLLAVALLATAVPATGGTAAAETRADERVIIQLDAAAGARSGSQQQSLRDQADKVGVTLRPSRQFSRLVNAVAATIPAGELGTVRALPGVKAVYPDLPMKATADANIGLIGAPDVWKREDRAGLTSPDPASPSRSSTPASTPPTPIWRGRSSGGTTSSTTTTTPPTTTRTAPTSPASSPRPRRVPR